MFLNLCSHVLGFAVISAVSVWLGVSDTVRCTVRARRSPFMMTSSDIQYCRPHFPSSSMECKKLLSYLIVLEREIFEQALVWSRIQCPAEIAGALESCLNCRARHRLSFILIEWCYLTLNPHFNVPEQQSSGSVPVEHFRSGVSLFVDDGEKKKKIYMAEILFLMSCMRCDVELSTNVQLMFHFSENVPRWILSAVVCSPSCSTSIHPSRGTSIIFSSKAVDVFPVHMVYVLNKNVLCCESSSVLLYWQSYAGTRASISSLQTWRRRFVVQNCRRL